MRNMIRFSFGLFSLMSFTLHTSALAPNSFPSGQDKTYKVDVSARANDLTLLSPQRTRFIAKHWENNILNGGLEIRKEDAHIIERIDKLYDIIDSTEPGDKRILYLSWSPLGAIREVLFLVVAEIDVEREKFVVKLVIQSPFWEPRQIESRHLKYALEDLVEDIEEVTLDMTELYGSDSRFRLAWLSWDTHEKGK